MPDSDPPSAQIDLRIEGAGWEPLPDPEAATEAAVLAALIVGGVSGTAALDVLLTDDSDMQALNAQWRGRDRPTNVLSFPAEAMPGAPLRFLGDLALGAGVMAREAAAAGLSLHDHYTHLVVHGVLHLLGHDHETEDEAAIMEALEVQALAGLGIASPYAMADEDDD